MRMRVPSLHSLLLAALLLPPAATVAQSGSGGDAVVSGPPTEIAVTDRGTVRMHVADTPLSTVLHLLSLEARRNIIASPNVSGNVTANLYDVTFDEALQAVLVSNGAAYRSVGNFIYVYTQEELEELEASRTRKPLTRVYRLNYISPSDAQAYLASVVDEEGTIAIPPTPAKGLKSDSEDAGGYADPMQDFVIVTARAEVHQQVRAILKQIDVRPRQVLVEATILRAELTDDNALGIDFTIVGGVDLRVMGARSSGLSDLTLGQLPDDRLDDFNFKAETDFAGNVPDGGLTIGIIEDDVALFIRALEEVTDTTVLANPKVLALNKQKGQVIVGRRDGYITTTVTETQAIQTVEFLETGTRLIFRPFVGDDGFIRIELHPADSVGFVNARGLPTEQTTEVTTNVIVRDGETILIGGLFREVTTDARSQIPGLGSIPWVGQLFRSNSNSTGREEVIILLTVHIVKDHAALAQASEDLMEDIERMRVGIRQGLMWHGRERLAQAHYRQAVDAAAAGDSGKAVWHLNLALHNNARMVPAIKLKEDILGERAWDEDGTGGRFFLRRLISQDKGYALPPFGRPKLPAKEPAELPKPPPEPVRDDDDSQPT